LAMTCFDFPALHVTVREHRLRLAEIVGLFETLAGILAQVHSLGLIHRDLNPSNILFDRRTGEVALVDFGSAIDIPLQSASGVEPDTVEGTLPYMSPEQTGRINRTLDFRTDFYSFGVTLYELLTGHRPFAGEDAGAIIHSHLALTPPAPADVDPAIPPTLSALVMKCLAKDAEDRYQSAPGLVADLHRCHAALETHGQIPDFALGTADVFDRFLFPERIVGRSRELQQLLGLYEQISTSAAAVPGGSRSAVVMVAGASGVGKTSLVREFGRAVAARGGVVVSGKYDQYSRAVPFSGLIQALSQLIRHILTLGDAAIAAWKARILNAVGQSGRVLCEVIPELETLLGEQPPVEVLDPVEARTRLGTLFRQFLAAVGRPERPLAIFLDDLQWIDAASLSLLELMGSMHGLGEEHAILCIGAYRDNEVSASHPLAVTLEAMRKREAVSGSIAEVVVPPLAEEDLRIYLAEMFHLSEADMASLATALHQKTAGNPLFFRTLLTSLHHDGHLRFDAVARRWTWDMAALAVMPYADNVVDVLQVRLAGLPAESVELLGLGACLGNPFSLDLLTALSRRPRVEVARGLAPALALGVLASARKDVELYAQQSADQLEDIEFSFCHDRIQQAAYALLDEAGRPALHLAAGRLLLRRLTPEQDDARLFDVLEHLRKGAALLHARPEHEQEFPETADPGPQSGRGSLQERLHVASLALRAGRRAKQATAFADAAELLDFARSLLPASSWSTQYALSLEVFLELAQSLYLAGRYDEAEARSTDILAHALHDRDRLRLFNIQAKQYHHQARYPEAVALELRALELLGVSIPEDPAALFPLFLAEKQRIHELLEQLAGGDPAALYHRPEIDAPNHVLTQEILFDLFADSYLLGRGLVCAVVAAVQARLAMECGNCHMTSVAYIHYACTLCAMGLSEADYRTGHAFGSVAVRLAERYAVPALQNYAYHVFSLAVNHWANPLRESHGYWFQASRLALASGSPYSGYVYLQLAHVLLAAGASLDEVEAQARRSHDFLVMSGMEGILTLLRLIVLQPVRHLRGQTHGMGTLDSADSPDLQPEEVFDTEALAEQFRELPFFLGSLRYSQLRVACLSGELPAPETLHSWIDVVDATQQGQIMLADSWFFYVLCLLEQAWQRGALPEEEQTARIETGLGKLRLWAALCPANFRHKLLLLEAERLAVQTAAMREAEPALAAALDTYDQAIDAALEAGFIQDAALAAEKAGRFWGRRHKPHLAKAYFEQALAFYARWGARGMEHRLRETYQSLLAVLSFHCPAPRAMEGDFLLETTSSTDGIGSQSFSEGVDLLAVVKATQAVSRHMVLDDLGRELTAIATENAGATKGVLILNKDGAFLVSNVVRAGTVAAPQCVFPAGQPIHQSAEISQAVVNYAVRSGRQIILNDIAGLASSGLALGADANLAALFTQCPYLLEHKPAALCCLPIVLQKEVRGLLYLENDATPGAFRKERVHILHILAAQAAISMENARIYQELGDMNLNLESLVRARTQELQEKHEELNTKNRELYRLSTTDQLTGAYNRRSIEERLGRELERCREGGHSLAIILLDVDHFKRVNDTYGHNVGDAVLAQVAATLANNVRSTDLFGRWGGEEFLVVISEFVHNALPFAERLRKSLEENPHPVAGCMTASMGLAIYRSGETSSQLVSRADAALYRAKQQGRNRVELAD
ncbi:diguanylate cyclase, partial [Megalodesulfovibrio paquesii]